MSDAHETYWCHRCEHVAIRTLEDVVLNNGLVPTIQASHSTESEVHRRRRERRIERLVEHLSRYPTTLEGDEGNIGGGRGAPPAAKSAVEALETFEVGSTNCVEEAERMSLVCAVCKDDIVMGEIGKKLPCGHCYHDNCILPWLETRNSCPVCRFQLPTDDAEHERKRAREEPPLTVFAGASSSTSMSGREENNEHHVVQTLRRSTRKRKPTRRFID